MRYIFRYLEQRTNEKYLLFMLMYVYIVIFQHRQQETLHCDCTFKRLHLEEGFYAYFTPEVCAQSIVLFHIEKHYQLNEIFLLFCEVYLVGFN